MVFRILDHIDVLSSQIYPQMNEMPFFVLSFHVLFVPPLNHHDLAYENVFYLNLWLIHQLLYRTGYRYASSCHT
uniref:Ovule protein n=1 Tax=Schistosoma curassoni TaxID=6186 RepID=A0A183L4U9_9TREM